MDKNFWRIGVKYVDLEMFNKGYPYVWGDGVTQWGYLDYLKDIRPGDIIVAGGIERISFIGEVKEKPVYLFPDDEENLRLYHDKGIAPALGPAAIEAFEPLENDYTDVVCIAVDWFAIDCSRLRMPTQIHGGVRPLTQEGIDYISTIIQKPEQYSSEKKTKV
ncbi:MAG: hypothetical protein LBT84_01760, partial [Spirochaetia bacterium]|nr:hypothetical protein [Spirochaetia bacterium]